MDSRNTQLEQLHALLAAAELDTYKDPLLATVRWSARMVPVPNAGTASIVGASRFGGNADLPSAESWPEHQGRPLVFLCQIRLDDLTDVVNNGDLPQFGLLSFFTAGMYAEECDDMFAAYGNVGEVRFEPDPSKLVSVPPPYADDPSGPLPVSLAGMQFAAELCLPPVEGPDIEPVNLVGTDAHARYWDDVWCVWSERSQEAQHRLLGHPDMNFNTHMKGDRLLLQIASDTDAINWEFGDYQSLRFLISQEALEARDFAQAWVNGDLE